jgi:hypothetical protein
MTAAFLLVVAEPVSLMFTCWRCRGMGEYLAIGIDGSVIQPDCEVCDCEGRIAVDLNWAATLVHNVAIAGGLCAAWLCGADYAHLLPPRWSINPRPIDPVDVEVALATDRRAR